jgi:hypothetical protein
MTIGTKLLADNHESQTIMTEFNIESTLEELNLLEKDISSRFDRMNIPLDDIDRYLQGCPRIEIATQALALSRRLRMPLTNEDEVREVVDTLRRVRMHMARYVPVSGVKNEAVTRAVIDSLPEVSA